MSNFIKRNQKQSMQKIHQLGQQPQATPEQMTQMLNNQAAQIEAAKGKDRIAQRTICLDLAQKTLSLTPTTAQNVIDTAEEYFKWMTQTA